MAMYQQVLTQLDTSESELLDVVNDVVGEIFSTMVGMEISTCETLSAAGSGFNNCVTAVICLSGSYLGAVSIHAQPVVAMEIASHMLEMEITAVDSDVTDAIGEIANMIAGSFKHVIMKGGHEVRLTPPKVVARNELFRPPESTPDILAVMFETGKGQLLVCVNLEVWD